MRHLLSGDKERVGQTAAYINAAGRTDEFAEKIAGCTAAARTDSAAVFKVPLLKLPYSERERRSALSALGALWGPMGREIALALGL